MLVRPLARTYGGAYYGGGVYVSQGNGQFTFDAGLPDCITTSAYQQADFNGDGRSDLICAFSDVTQNKIFLSTGQTLFAPNVNVSTAGGLLMNTTGLELVANASMVGATYSTGDFNGDGRSDILRAADVPGNNALFLSNGDGTFRRSTSFAIDGLSGLGMAQLVKSDRSAQFITGDFLGIGSAQILRMLNGADTATSDAGKNQLYVKSNSTLPDQLLSVTSPMGLTTTITYNSLANSAGRYVNERTDAAYKAVFPIVDLTMASPVVITIETDTGVASNTVKTEYAYRGLKAALDGRGMLGFRQTVQQNSAPNGDPLSVWSSYVLDAPYAGVAKMSETRRGSWTQPGASLLSRTVNIYCDKTSPTDVALAADPLAALDPASLTENSPCTSTAKVKRPYLRRSVEVGIDLAGVGLPTVTTINSYNDYGDPNKIWVTSVGRVNGADYAYAKVTVNSFCLPGSTLGDGTACPNKIDGDNWILGRLNSSTVTNTVPNLLAALPANAGPRPNATATTGLAPSNAPPSPINPAVLTAIFQLLLED